MKKHYVEIICDWCGNCDYHRSYVKNKKNLDKDMRRKGWVITADGKHFDTKECYNNYKGNQHAK